MITHTDPRKGEALAPPESNHSERPQANASPQPYAAYKPSGLPWLGDIPAHWKAISIKQAYSIQLGKMLQNNLENAKDTLVPYLRALHVRWNDVVLDDLPEMWASPIDLKKYSLQKGDLLVCEGGEVGRAAILREQPGVLIIQNALHRVRTQLTS